MTKKLKIGITGGVGSGKSLAARYFEKLGYPVIYADKVAKQLYASNKKLLAKLVNAFGSGILDNNRNLSRENARRIIFSSRKNIKRVNSIVHPFVFREMDKIYAKLKSRIVFFEAAIMFESGSYKRMNYVLLIYTNKELRIKRLIQRDKIKRADVLKIMKLQIPEKEKLKRADFIIKNNSSPAELKKKITALSKLINVL